MENNHSSRYYAGKSVIQRHDENLLYNLNRKVPETTILSQFLGTYRGIAPTGESQIKLGELEIVITNDSMKFRHATRLGIEEGEVSVSEFSPLQKDEIKSLYIEESKSVERVIGLTAKGMKYLFLPNAGDGEVGLILRGNEVADDIAPTLLFSPQQIKEGIYEKSIAELNDYFGKDCYITLKNTKGKVPENIK